MDTETTIALVGSLFSILFGMLTIVVGWFSHRERKSTVSTLTAYFGGVCMIIMAIVIIIDCLEKLK